MTWVAVWTLIGGWRGATLLALSAVLGGALAVQTWRLDSTQVELTSVKGEFRGYQDRMIAATAKVAALAEKAHVEYQEASARAESAYQAGRDSAEQHQATVVADLRSGNLRLREQWRGCVSAASPGQAPGTAPSGQDAADELRTEAAGRVVSVGREADLTAAWLQAELLATRRLAESCGKTE